MLDCSGRATKKIEIDAIHTVANIAAAKYQAERTRSPLVAPKKTIAPDKNVRIDTVASSITINCIYLLFNYYSTINGLFVYVYMVVEVLIIVANSCGRVNNSKILIFLIVQENSISIA